MQVYINHNSLITVKVGVAARWVTVLSCQLDSLNKRILKQYIFLLK